MTIKQLIVLLVLLALGVAIAAVYHFKPHLVSREHLEQVLGQAKSISIREHLSGGENDDSEQSPLEHHIYSAEDVKKATREVLQQKKHEQEEMSGDLEQGDIRERFSTEVAPEGKKYLYQLEFANGTGTLAEKVSFGNGTVSYESSSGIRVTVAESSVVSMQRIVIKLQQQSRN